MTAYYDFANGDGLYLDLRAEHAFRIGDVLGVRILGSIGYNGGQWLAEETSSGFSDLNYGIDFPVSLGPFRIVPFVRHTTVLLDAPGGTAYFRYSLSLGFATGS